MNGAQLASRCYDRSYWQRCLTRYFVRKLLLQQRTDDLPGIRAWTLLAALFLVRSFSSSVRSVDGDRRVPLGHIMSSKILMYFSPACAEIAVSQVSRILLHWVDTVRTLRTAINILNSPLDSTTHKML